MRTCGALADTPERSVVMICPETSVEVDLARMSGNQTVQSACRGLIC